MINILRAKNQQLLSDYVDKNDHKSIMKHKVIGALLKYDDCFLRLSFEQGYTILKSLDIRDWKTVYAKLLSA